MKYKTKQFKMIEIPENFQKIRSWLNSTFYSSKHEQIASDGVSDFFAHLANFFLALRSWQ